MVIDKTLIIASAIIKNNKDEILLLKRGATKTFKGYWQLPEGKLEKSEKPQDALKREIREELGTDANTVTLENVSQSTLKAMGITYLALRIIFMVTLKGNTITLSHEHSNYRWIKPNKTFALELLPGTSETIQILTPCPKER